jgi:large subunit ribosomal protein LP2
MKHIAAYALLVLSGKNEPSAADVEKVLKEAGVKAEAGAVEKLCAALKGKAFHELVASGIAAMGSMGSAAPAASSAGPAAAAAPVKEEEPEEEEDVDMGDLFGGDY